jgi:hypothetical protein
VPDSEATTCCQQGCDSKFGFFGKSRHHCRQCGNIFCDKCCKGEGIDRKCTNCKSQEIPGKATSIERPNTDPKFTPNPENIETLTIRYNFIHDNQARQLLHDALLKKNGNQGEALQIVDGILQTISNLSTSELNKRVIKEQPVLQRTQTQTQGAAAVARYVPNPDSVRQVMVRFPSMERRIAVQYLTDALEQFNGDQARALYDALHMEGGYKMSRKSKVKKMSRKSKAKMSRKSKAKKMSRKSKVEKRSRKSRVEKRSRKSKAKMSRKK